jgi:hypothetical protein
LLSCAPHSLGVHRDSLAAGERILGRALLGVLLNEPDGQLFSELTVEIENLTEWDYRPDVVFEIEEDENLPIYTYRERRKRTLMIWS